MLLSKTNNCVDRGGDMQERETQGVSCEVVKSNCILFETTAL